MTQNEKDEMVIVEGERERAVFKEDAAMAGEWALQTGVRRWTIVDASHKNLHASSVRRSERTSMAACGDLR